MRLIKQEMPSPIGHLYRTSGADPGFELGGGGVNLARGLGTAEVPADPGQSPGRGSMGAKPPGSSCILAFLGPIFVTTK